MMSIPIAIVPIVSRRRGRRGRDRRILGIVALMLVLMLIGILVSVLAGMTIRSALRHGTLRTLSWIPVTRLYISISAAEVRALFRARSARDWRRSCG